MPKAPVTEVEKITLWLGLRLNDHFHEREEIDGLIERGIFHSRAGGAIHFQGPADLGKTLLARGIAQKLQRPVSVILGNDWSDVDDMIGKEVGQNTSSVVDRHIRRVRRSEQQMRYPWEDSILAEAMEKGHSLAHDEFSSAMAHGMPLSVREDGGVISTDQVNQGTGLQAHRDFHIILTWNPQDYAGVYGTPDALLVRMGTFTLGGCGAETRAGILIARVEALRLRSGALSKALRAQTPAQDDHLPGPWHHDEAGGQCHRALRKPGQWWPAGQDRRHRIHGSDRSWRPSRHLRHGRRGRAPARPLLQAKGPGPVMSYQLQGVASSDGLADVRERILDTGIGIAGDISISRLGIALLTFRRLIATRDKAKEMGIHWWESDPNLSADHERLRVESQALLARITALEGKVAAQSHSVEPRTR